MTCRINRAILAVLVVEVHQHVAVHAVGGQQNQDNEVRNQQRQVKTVGVVLPLEGFVEEMLLNVMPNALRGHESGEKRR